MFKTTQLSSRQQNIATETTVQSLLTVEEDEFEKTHVIPPHIQTIGLLGFDAEQQKFVLLNVATEEKTLGSSNCPPTLSEREQEVLQLVACGATNHQIAYELIISPHTVKVHLQNIYDKLKVRSRTEAVVLAASQGWIALTQRAVVPLAA